MTHTPGPWHRNIRANGKYPTIFAGRNQHVTCACQQQNAAETEANIDLIAAAPELLEALKNLVDTINNNGSTVARLDATAFAMAAIAKAEGQQ